MTCLCVCGTVCILPVGRFLATTATASQAAPSPSTPALRKRGVVAEISSSCDQRCHANMRELQSKLSCNISVNQMCACFRKGIRFRSALPSLYAFRFEEGSETMPIRRRGKRRRVSVASRHTQINQCPNKTNFWERTHRTPLQFPYKTYFRYSASRL